MDHDGRAQAWAARIDEPRFVLIEEEPIKAENGTDSPAADAPCRPLKAASPTRLPSTESADSPQATAAMASGSARKKGAAAAAAAAAASPTPLPSTESADSPQVTAAMASGSARKKGAAAAAAAASPTPLPSTELADSPQATAAMASGSARKKGTAAAAAVAAAAASAAAKKPVKRPRNGGPGRRNKRNKAARGGDDDESDNGPYCLCRGPDDHRWMICCETCEDWFHGECIDLTKEIGESLIEKFVCPGCTEGNRRTIYKKTCALGACRRPARLAQETRSVFCSGEHAQAWWERTMARLPRAGAGGDGVGSPLAQDELMVLLGSRLGGVDEAGAWVMNKGPFSGALPRDDGGDGGDKGDAGGDWLPAYVLSDEEKALLEGSARARAQIGEETVLCHKMVTLLELAQERRRGAIAAGRFGDDVCGYDARLDTISARDAFAAYARSTEGAAALCAATLGDPLGEGDEARGMCERKRCKVHGGWQKMLLLGIKHQIREMANQAAEVGAEERSVREAAGERWKRKQAERNWVEVLE